MWVKICANTNLEDALLAAEAGADAVGFVFAPSPRRVKAEDVARITQFLPREIETIGVFVDAGFEQIARAVESCSLSGIQLHYGVDAGVAAQLRTQFGDELRILRVVHFGADAASEIERLAHEMTQDAVLVDSRTATAVGGTGLAFDWKTAQEKIFTGEGALKLIAAGGLNAENVAEAIRMLNPWGVDVASGVEQSPGKKDPAKVRAFVQNARTAKSSQKSEPIQLT
jgi:phosphoribosylanthranilate isomerase